MQEIRDALAKVKTTKGFGVDNISSFFLKLALPFAEYSLTLSLNTSIETSIFPELWKLEGLLLFSKMETGLTNQIIDLYQYYQLLKALRKLVANQLYQNVIDNGLLSPAQSAYRHFHSSVTHLLENINDW